VREFVRERTRTRKNSACVTRPCCKSSELGTRCRRRSRLKAICVGGPLISQSVQRRDRIGIMRSKPAPRRDGSAMCGSAPNNDPFRRPKVTPIRATFSMTTQLFERSCQSARRLTPIGTNSPLLVADTPGIGEREDTSAAGVVKLGGPVELRRFPYSDNEIFVRCFKGGLNAICRNTIGSS
jgi:hypothetical protein